MDAQAAPEQVHDLATSSGRFGYFVPDALLCVRLVWTIERGVQVHILADGATDLPFRHRARQHTSDRLLSAGIWISQRQEPYLR